MRTITIYQFDELTPEAQKKAFTLWHNNVKKLDNFFEFEIDDQFNWLIESKTEELEAMGFADPKIRYSLSYCQGDGASFTTENCNIFALNEYFKVLRLSTNELVLLNDCKISIVKNHYATHYAHNKTVDFHCNANDLFDEYGELLEIYTAIGFTKKQVFELIDTVTSKLIDLACNEMKKIEKEGYDIIDYFNEDQTYIDYFDNCKHDHEYLENGAIFKF